MILWKYHLWEYSDTMEYKTVTEEEKDDIIVSFLHQQEIDHLCHSINKERYDNILNDTDIDEQFREKIQRLRDEVEIRLNEVEKIIKHTNGQVPSQERINTALERINSKDKR